MIRRRSAHICLLAVAMCAASLSRAGVWGSQPVLGVSTDYSSNPALLNESATAETHAALLIDAPTTYNGDAFKFTVLPSARVSDSQGYSTLDSDYVHLNASGEFDTERSTLTAVGGVARDSSLYHDYLLSGSTGVRRDTLNADVNWDRQLTERFDFDTDVNTVHVRYGAASGEVTLTDYKYTSVNPSLVWKTSELGKLTATVSAGRYDSLDGATESTNINLQLGFTKQLSDIWSLTTSAGYSHATNKINVLEEGLILTPQGPEIVIFPVELQSTQNGTVYSANLSRHTERLALTVAASRQLVPSGFAYLSQVETYELVMNFNESERLSFSGDLRRVDYRQPGSVGDQESINLQVGAAWRWTEQWTVNVGASRLLEHYGSPTIGIVNNGFTLELSRHFNWKTFQ